MTERRRVIYVPGKNLKPEPTVHRKHLWRCLLDGIRRVDAPLARDIAGEPDTLVLAAWNHGYYGGHASMDADIPWIDRVIDSDGAAVRDIEQASAWHRVATQFMYEAGDRFHWLIKWIPDERVKSMIRDTEPYFQNHNGAADQIRAVVKRCIVEATYARERVLLIGHSLGSVIAYDAMWQLTHVDNMSCSVDLFLTLGSPLGMRFVQKHLLGRAGPERSYPSGMRRWENVSATGDLVSLDKTVHGDFERMIEDGHIESIHDHCGRVFNWFRNDDGLNVHRSYGYLVNPVVGRIVADWWYGRERSRAPALVAHRGYPSKYPENTKIGFLGALEAGAEYLELDVQLSADGFPVVYHDADTSRISGIEGSLFDLAIDEIGALGAHVPAKFGDAFLGNPVMTLAEFCALLADWPRVHAFVEIKADSIDRFGLEETVDAVVDAIAVVSGRCTLISFHDKCIEYARAAHGASIGWVLSTWSRQSEARARSLDPDFIFVSKRLVPSGACALWSGPWRWAVYVVDEAVEANRYTDRGIEYVETDCIGEMMRSSALRKQNRRNTMTLSTGAGQGTHPQTRRKIREETR